MHVLLAGLIPIWDVNRGVPQISAIMVDGHAKPTHYRKAGICQSPVRCFNVFWGPPNDKIAEETATGISGEALVSIAAVEGSACESHLSCARHTAKTSALLDSFGLTGGFCTHGSAAEGMVVDMTTPERFR